MQKMLAQSALLFMLAQSLFASDKTAVVRGNTDEVFDAVATSAQRYWTVSFADRRTQMLSFVTGRSFTSKGMECSVRLRPVDKERIEIVMHTQKKGEQLFAFGVGDRIADKLFDTVKEELARPGGPTK